MLWNWSGSLGCQFSWMFNFYPHILDLTCGIQQWEEVRKVSSSMSFKIIAGILGNPIHWHGLISQERSDGERICFQANSVTSRIGERKTARICRNPVHWQGMISQAEIKKEIVNGCFTVVMSFSIASGISWIQSLTLIEFTASGQAVGQTGHWGGISKTEHKSTGSPTLFKIKEDSLGWILSHTGPA